MSNEFRGTGNLGMAPVLRRVSVKGADRPVCDLRIFFDEYSRDDRGEITQSGGFWLTGSVWDRRAEWVAKLLRKGSRVRVEGRLREETWEDRESGTAQSAFRLAIDDVFPVLSRIESIHFREKAAGGDDNQDTEE